MTVIQLNLSCTLLGIWVFDLLCATIIRSQLKNERGKTFFKNFKNWVVVSKRLADPYSLPLRHVNQWKIPSQKFDTILFSSRQQLWATKSTFEGHKKGVGITHKYDTCLSASSSACCADQHTDLLPNINLNPSRMLTHALEIFGWIFRGWI